MLSCYRTFKWLNRYFCTYAPRLYISLKKYHDLQICTRPTCRGILCDVIRKKIFSKRKFFSNLQTCKYDRPGRVDARGGLIVLNYRKTKASTIICFHSRNNIYITNNPRKVRKRRRRYSIVITVCHFWQDLVIQLNYFKSVLVHRDLLLTY